MHVRPAEQVRKIFKQTFLFDIFNITPVRIVLLCVYKSVTSMNYIRGHVSLQWCQWQQEPHVLVQKRLKVNWKLLIWPSPPFTIGLEQNIYIDFTCSVSLHAACFAFLSVFLSPHIPSCPSCFLIQRYKFRCQWQHFTSLSLKWSQLFPLLTLLWLFPLCVNELWLRAV